MTVVVLKDLQDVLRDAASLIGEDGSNWVADYEAVDGDYNGCAPDSEHASKWCAVGVLCKLVQDRNVRHMAAELLAESVGGVDWGPGHNLYEGLARWNDNGRTTGVDVHRALMDAATRDDFG